MERENVPAILFYEVADTTGTYWTGVLEDDPVDFGKIAFSPLDWEIALSRLMNLAEELDTELLLALAITDFAPISR